MARVRKHAGGPGVWREFTEVELARIWELTSELPGPAHGPGPRDRELNRELDEIHAAAGRNRGVMMWMLHNEHDRDAAYAEELAGGLH